jgi:hypothetical protein
MPEQSKSIPLDLTRYTEATRREVYDRCVRHLWTPEAPGDYTPSYTPDAAQMTVAYSHGRWFLSYIDLEEPVNAPLDRRAVLSRIIAAPDRPLGLMLSEI